MISIYAAMLMTLGFLFAALMVLLFLPVYRRRAQRLAIESIKRTLPLTEHEIIADKDRLRAEYALDVHRLEARLESSTMAAARQSIEINRREARITDLENEIARLTDTMSEYENARRVLELTIVDRLPRVEQRLTEAKKLLFQRDREIAQLSLGSEKQQAALDQAKQMNVQQSDELYRLRATVETRASRNRAASADAAFDTEVALRTELESLKSQVREQTKTIIGLESRTLAEPALDGEAASPETIRLIRDGEMEELKLELADLRQALATAKVSAKIDAAKISEVPALRLKADDQSREILRLRAELLAQATAPTGRTRGKESLAVVKSRVAMLEAEVASQHITINGLKAELEKAAEAASAQRVASQQAALQQVSSQQASSQQVGAPAVVIAEVVSGVVVSPEADEDAKSLATTPLSPRRSLRERIVSPRGPDPSKRHDRLDEVEIAASAANGNADHAHDQASAHSSSTIGSGIGNPSPDPIVSTPPRRPRLLDRIGTIKS